MRISAKVDYALRAACVLAAEADGALVKAERIAEEQDIPRKFLDAILQQMRHGGIIESRRGPEGGHRLARPAGEIALADVIRAIDGPLANVGGASPDQLDHAAPATALRDVWVAVRSALRGVLEQVTLGDLVSGELPPEVVALTEAPGAWSRR